MKRQALGKVLYAVLFVLVAPAALVGWAIATDSIVPLPTIPYGRAALIPIVVGLSLMVAGFAALVPYGKGLPMNPYPPPVYVSRGIYRFTPHPIYLGFVIACFGVAIFLESPAGIWLVSPTVALALTALVLGYERHDLRRRFGAEAIHKPLVSLPPDRPDPPTPWDRASIYLLVLIPWSVAFEAVYRLGVPVDAIVAHLPRPKDQLRLPDRRVRAVRHRLRSLRAGGHTPETPGPIRGGHGGGDSLSSDPRRAP